MTGIKLEIKRMAKEGKEVCLFFVYCGHGVEIDNQTHAVMENGVEFINIKKFILSCAK
jgi:pyridoxine 5'-phosphate synthase PdxJ